jgi:RHS repeat-associated protein
MCNDMTMTLEKNRAEFWGSNGAESPEREEPQGFSVSWGKRKWSTIDANGNELASQAYKYTWDAANRLISVSSINATPATVADTVTFTYDGYGRRVGIVESHGSTVLTSKTFVWCGSQLCQERDGTGHTVNKRFYGVGEQISGTNYYYAKDRLGNIREMTDNDGNIQANYDYDLWGRQTQLSGSLSADFGFTGFYMERAAGLDLTWFRAYDPEKGRWLSRDPFEERVGLNLYEYAKDDPIRFTDPKGQCCQQSWFNCWANCISANDLLSDDSTFWLTLFGGSIPKWALGLPQGLGGASPYTSLPSAGAYAAGGGAAGTAGAALRSLGTVANAAWIAYGILEAMLESSCAALCAQYPCSY